MNLNDNNYYAVYSTYPASADIFVNPRDGWDMVTDNQWNQLASALISTQKQAIGVLDSSQSTAATTIYGVNNPFPLPLGAPATDKGKLILVGFTADAQTSDDGYTCNIFTPSGYILNPASLKVSLINLNTDIALPSSCKLWVSKIRYEKEATQIKNILTISVMSPFRASGTREQLAIFGHMIGE